ncbi:SCO family protein [Lichenibacterium dinghuense]|uniref:SCO family protein n=1 Tax=Lichenibacterium dinghuense TaxID=2895977 RepID=UPI001F298D8C|nr:SCO family protein [Lichenibacterium sp. 6Y81]
MIPRRVLLLVGGIAAAAMVGLAALVLTQTGSAGPSRRIGGAFATTEMTGRPVTEADLVGRPTALFFGFTRCPATCPVTLQVLTTVLGRMGPDADRLNAVFVTLDPARDTPEAMRDYLGSFDPRIRGFVGTDAQTAAMAKAFKVQVRRVPLEGGDYTMDHTAAVILLDARGRFAGTVSADDDEKAILARLEGLVGAAPGTAGGSTAAGG